MILTVSLHQWYTCKFKQILHVVAQKVVKADAALPTEDGIQSGVITFYAA